MIVQSRTSASIGVIGRLIETNRLVMERRSAFEQTRVEVARAIVRPMDAGSPRLDGAPYDLVVGDRRWSLELQDVEGLIDLYLADPGILRRAGLDPSAIEAGRRLAAREGGATGRFATLSQTLARFGLPPSAAAIATQRAAHAGINPDNLSIHLPSRLAEGLSDRVSAQARTVAVRLGRASEPPRLR